MFFKYPKNSERFYWTKHAKEKMKFYRLSENRIKKVIRQPKRREIGVAPGTIALMQPGSIKLKKGKPSWREEIWVMIEEGKKRLKIISTWRYPGVSPVGKKIPIPNDIREELEKIDQAFWGRVG